MDINTLGYDIGTGTWFISNTVGNVSGGATIEIIIWLLFSHWLSDFYMQNNWMAVNKSKDFIALSVHCIVYALSMTALLVLFLWHERPHFSITLGLLARYATMVYATHIIVDFITSKINARLFKPWFDYVTKPDKPIFVFKEPTLHWFFVSIGFDQFLHYVTLIWICVILHIL